MIRNTSREFFKRCLFVAVIFATVQWNSRVLIANISGRTAAVAGFSRHCGVFAAGPRSKKGARNLPFEKNFIVFAGCHLPYRHELV
jgi:hypothetical protein